MSHPDTNEIVHEYHGWDGKCFYDDADTTKDQDIINWLKSENAYLRGKIEVYEKFLKDRGYIKEKEYTLADFVKGRVDDETLDRIAIKADELQRENLSKEDKAVADKAAKQEAHAIQPEEKKKSRYSIDFRDVDAKLAECTTVDEVNKYADELLAKKLTINQRAAIKEKIYDRRRAIIILENM